ncbi:MAG: N-acetylmuramic acid 6-phosphate etherase [Armatimonadetes bacterium]|nr:N-acetylmuramic acid 6-phosphate etherase [Armatimonadota bacterium]
MEPRYETLVTEEVNPRTRDLDALPTEEILRRINAEDRGVPDAVAAVIPDVARAVEAAEDAMRRGGRLIYVGAGTSGRIGVLDATECPPTFGVGPEVVQAIVAGGAPASVASAAGVEDDREQGARDVAERGVGPDDVVVGIAASGTTPYVLGAMEEARRRGATTVGLCCNPAAPLATMARIAICPVVGPEVIMGSTRMKAGTAQKLILNMLSTTTMVRLGKVYQNLMVDMKPLNRKLAARARRMLMIAASVDAPRAEALLDQARGNLKAAIVMAVIGCAYEDALRRLEQSEGFVRRAIAKRN